MKRSPTSIIGILLIAVPFAFGLLRALHTNDLRYLWMAAAALAGAGAVMGLARTRSTAVQVNFTSVLVAIVVASVVGRLTAALLGGKNAAAVWMVAIGFAVCEGVGCAMVRRAVNASTPPIAT
jgi:cbb3-type cytochrome oxidase subunit 1